jgi:ribosomal-protein-alanine N-acetyltransferase
VAETCLIREMRESDLKEVLEIERASFPDPWPYNWFREAIGSRYVCRAAVLDFERLIGYYIAAEEDDRRVHLANIAVDEEYRQQGIASSMIEDLVRIARSKQCGEVYLEVRKSNLEAIKLYYKFGFVLSMVDEGYYNGEEDALILTLELQ